MDKESLLTAQLAKVLALKCGFAPIMTEYIGMAAVLHDIGKTFISKSIINKPGPLSPQEREIIKTHTVLGADIFLGLQGPFGIIARNVCRFHHEDFNSGGYWNKSTTDLPLYVPIVAICDRYVALVNRRVYKPAWPHADALDYIRSKAGEQFCPKLVDIFIETMNEERMDILN